MFYLCWIILRKEEFVNGGGILSGVNPVGQINFIPILFSLLTFAKGAWIILWLNRVDANKYIW